MTKIFASASLISTILDCLLRAFGVTEQHVTSDNYKWVWIFSALGWMIVLLNLIKSEVIDK